MEDDKSYILYINRIQLLLAEKRTTLSMMRTGIAILALPLSIFSLLIATSKLYDLHHVWLLLSFVTLLNFLLIAFAIYLIVRSLMRMHHYDSTIKKLKQQHKTLQSLI